MDITTISISVSLGLIGLSVLALLIFGARSLTYGKQSATTIIMMVVPFAVFAIIGFAGITESPWGFAVIVTSLLWMALNGIALLVASGRGAIGM